MKLLLDTNVLFDYYLRREPFHHEWIKLRAMQMFGDVELWASAKSFTDIFYVVEKAVGSKPIQKAIADSMGFLELCSVGAEDIFSAAEASWDDFEDCLVDICAQKVKADFIISRDQAGFAQAKVTACSPLQFFDWFEQTTKISYAKIDLE